MGGLVVARVGVESSGPARCCSQGAERVGLLSPALPGLGQSLPAPNMGKTYTCMLLFLTLVRTFEVQL